jgi:hypothetical protein
MAAMIPGIFSCNITPLKTVLISSDWDMGVGRSLLVPVQTANSKNDSDNNDFIALGNLLPRQRD